MDRKERILAFINEDSYIPLKADELITVLDVPKSDIDEFNKIIEELCTEGKIYSTKKGKFLPCNKADIISGVLSCNANKGFGFVKLNDSDEVFIDSSNMNMAYHNDTVLVNINNNSTRKNHREGAVIRVLKRGNKKIVGVVRGIKGNKFMITPDKREFFSEIGVSADRLGGAKKNDRVLVSIDRYTERNLPIGTVLTVLGTKDSIGSCLDGLLADRGLFADFSYLVKEEVLSVSDTVSDMEISGREDLRNKTVITIDGDDSRDFDDAVSLEELSDGNVLLGVHIADVTHYVKDGTELDREALNRATSVYFPHKVIPMLPKELSNGICSLNPNVDRLTLSVFMEIDKDGNIHSNRIAETVIHSSYRMTYNDVNKIFDGDKELCGKYSDIVPMLNKMNELSKILADKRKLRGAIDFDFPETKVLCDEDANPVEIVAVDRGDSHKLIESFMLAANETVAQTAFWSELPFVYRVHEAPGNEKLTEFNQFIKNFGYSIKGKLDSETILPKALQKIADEVKGTPEEFMISKMMLRSLMKACYRDTNDGHFGLAAKFYCHFTSPIRRYPDLIIHRVLKDFINGNLNDDKRKHYEKLMKNAAEISSEREVEAEKAERDAVDMLKAAYMREAVGESFDATITSVTSFGMFAMLENSCEGLIRYETMNGDYFEYDDINHIVKGNHTNKIYKIGDNIRITVVSADILSRRIDFVREEDNNFHTVSKIVRRSKPYKSPKNFSPRKKNKRR